jgi:hypothetical protein
VDSWRTRGNKHEDTRTMSRKVTVGNASRRRAMLINKTVIRVTQVGSGHQRGSNDRHEDDPTTSGKAAVRVTRVIDETCVSRGILGQWSRTPMFLQRWSSILVAPVDHDELPPLPTAS